MINFKDSVTKKIYWLILVEVSAEDIFMFHPVSGLFPCGGISNSCYLSCLVFLKFSFLSVAKIFKGSSLSYLIYITLVEPQSLFFFPANTNTEPLSQNSMSLVQQPEIDWFSLAASFFLGPECFILFTCVHMRMHSRTHVEIWKQCEGIDYSTIYLDPRD